MVYIPRKEMEYISLVFMLLFSFSATASDQQSLLAFKAAISFDPNNSLVNWNSNFPVCNWTGVTCSPDLQRVIKLILPHMALQGTISPVVGNLSGLKSLNLSYNELQGGIPGELSLLKHLEMLSLRENHLQGNIPSSLGSLSDLAVLDLSTNNFQGLIPAELGMLTQLKKLNLDVNQLSGPIPSSMGNLSALELLDLYDNQLQGSIPVELSLLIHLDTLHLRLNNLTGTISSFLGNLSALADLDLGENHLHGPIPVEVGTLPKLRELYLDLNHFSGSIPISIGNLSALEDFFTSKNNLTGNIPAEVGMLANLQLLTLWENKLSGSIPRTLGNCSKLQILNLRNNQLSGIVPVELGKLLLLEKVILEHNRLGSDSKNSLDFVTALTNCSHLEYIKVSYNHLAGVLPPSIGHLSPKLSILQLGYNRIRGSIPPEITHLTNLITLNLSANILNGYIPSGIKRFQKLETLHLSGNRLKGSLPEEIGQMKTLGLLDVSWNKLSGSIPASLAKPQQVRRVYLHHNHFSGEIPSSLQRCENLELLDLSHNELVGRIPGEVMASLESLQFYLNFSWNKLQGPLPGEISKIVNARAIDISCNQLDGTIPAALANCIALEHLNLSHNAIEGLIPDALEKLQNLESIDLSFNFLSGTIPISLRKIKVLRYLNVCFNNLTGRIPEQGLFPNSTVNALLMGNEGLCGPKTYSVSACPKQGLSLLAKVLLSAAGFIAFILCSLVLRILWYRNKQFDLLNFILGRLWRPKFTYQDLSIATNGFNEANLLGVGRFGSVYRGVLRDGKVIAIKVFNLQNEEVHNSFKKECRVLGMTRHRNLVRVISVCSYPDFKALILEFAVNGSLEKYLYPNSHDEDVCGFNLGECLNIATDVAHAMEYLHHDSPVQVVHCDLKPSNVLLDADMKALVTDFGISKLTGLTNSMESLSITFALRGSIGYIAPEYGLGGNISIKGDVYSYGILLLEMITKKRPTDSMFVEDFTLQKWVRTMFPHRVADFVDSRLLVNVNVEQNNCIVCLIHIALLCTNEPPQERPTMREVRNALEVFTATFMGGATTASNLTSTISDLVHATNATARSGSQSSTY